MKPPSPAHRSPSLASVLRRLLRIEEEPLGVFIRILAARSKDDIENAQDGGVVSTILKHLFEQKSIDGAIVAGMKEGSWEPFPRVAKNFDDVIASARTKFGISPNLMLIRDAVLDEYLERICVVGLPCHTRALRHMQHIKFELAPAISFTIGLFCRENYEYLSLRKYIEGVLGEGSLAEVRKFSVKEDAMLVHFSDSESDGEKTLSIPITEVKKWVPRHCLLCSDFTNELADISVGCDGSPEGFSTVIVRTELGERIFSAIEAEGLLETKPADIAAVREIAERKREKAKQTAKIYDLRSAGLSAEEIATRLGIELKTVLHRLEKY
ncbi:MAG: Coenzyme F420 hydrogenase/dehydrogenase, beta subunit C-terminal domain [Methanophagales archaeon]|nr:Coenzyme F420 hydrogenase/dehydrogenase, beta subunit C-terminal domain [Methanophagales archaeon]